MRVMGNRWRTAGRRWIKFYFVGVLGIGVQMVVLWLLRSKLHVEYLIATALAVETAIIHNFCWHERFTWADRTGCGRSMFRFFKFNAATGLFSIVGNLLVMKVLIDLAQLEYLLANLMAIGSCSLFNFVASDTLVFRMGRDKRSGITSAET
jgi:putative flippase GtrA